MPRRTVSRAGVGDRSKATDRTASFSDPGVSVRHVANALTAILLHAEAIQRRSPGMTGAEVEIAASARHIVLSAKGVWDCFEAAMHADREPRP